MKKIVLLGFVMAFALLAGCQDSQKNAQLVTCQEEKLAIQGQVDQLNTQLATANASIAQKDQLIEKQKADIREVNQKALESIRTMMEKQNAKDVELKNALKAKEAEALNLQQKVSSLETQLKSASVTVTPAPAAADTAAPKTE